jgi:hypothetical protein
MRIPRMRKKKLRNIRAIRIRVEVSVERKNSRNIEASLMDISLGVQGGMGARCEGLGREILRHHRFSHVPGRDCWAT